MGMGQVTSYPCSSHQTSWDLWMFIPLKQWHVSIYGDISYVHITKVYGIKLDIYIYISVKIHMGHMLPCKSVPFLSHYPIESHSDPIC